MVACVVLLYSDFCAPLVCEDCELRGVTSKSQPVRISTLRAALVRAEEKETFRQQILAEETAKHQAELDRLKQEEAQIRASLKFALVTLATSCLCHPHACAVALSPAVPC